MNSACIIYCYNDASEIARLTNLANERGWPITQILTENPATAPDQRAGIAVIRRMLATGSVQAILVPTLLMLGASLDELVALIAKMSAAGVHLISEIEGIDTTTPEGAAWMSAVASMQGFQQALRHQKVRAGQLRAKAAGVKFGRPALSVATIKNVRASLAAGHGVRPTGRKTGVSAARVSAEKQAMRVAGNI